MSKPVYVSLEVGGIQNYISDTGKLKEMIGASEIIHYIFGAREDTGTGQPSFLDEVILGLKQVTSPCPGDDWYILVQNNAGVLHIILANEDRASKFMEAFSRKVFEKFPGLPFFGASAPLDWNTAAYKQARKALKEAINRQRASFPVFQGMPMLPITRFSRLDGLPAFSKSPDHREYISLPSACRSQGWVLKQARDRLRGYMRAYANAAKVVLPKVEWKDDLEEMLEKEKCNIALICMDGNDLGLLFRNCLAPENEKGVEPDIEKGIKRMMALSRTVNNCTTRAFAAASLTILREMEKEGKKEPVVMPLRPLIIGGDDITVIIRADLALLFISSYVEAFEASSAEALEELSRDELKGILKPHERKLTLGIGMVVTSQSWPFTRAYNLAEKLQKNAKKITRGKEPRPSSLDYLVLTSEVEPDLEVLRKRVYTAEDGTPLTGKPFLLRPGGMARFMENGQKVLDRLPRSLLRGALAVARKGRYSLSGHYLNLIDNLERGLGGRHNKKLLLKKEFNEIFAEGFVDAAFPKADDNAEGFFSHDSNGREPVILGDYLELSRLLRIYPEDAQATPERDSGA